MSCQDEDNGARHKNTSSLIETFLKKSTATATVTAMVVATILTTPLQLEVGGIGMNVGQQHVEIVQSRASALTEEQLLVTDVWREVTRQYVDTTYNGLGEDGWKQKRLDAVKSVPNVGPEREDKEKVYSVIRKMLSSLGDPYTRFLTPEQYESLTAYARGGSSGGVGVQLMLDPASGKVLVLNTVKDGPAEKAGVLPGDVVVEVDGMEMNGATAEVVAAKCRGEAGTQLNLAVRHGGDGRADSKVQQLTVTREPIKSSPVAASTFDMDGGKKVGLIKVPTFSTQTTSQVSDALRQVRGSSAVVMDLRGNAGGYMPAGVDVAKLFLPPQTRVISEVDKSGRSTIYVADGIGSDTVVPLYLLVDKRTASASEILTAALQDNHRATVVGEKTFGKGRIQNVQELEDGSGIAVTKAKYMTPEGRDIHGVGITPNKIPKSCGPDDSAATCLSGLL